MHCPACGFDNLAGSDGCEFCSLSLTQEDLPLARVRSRIEQSLKEETVGILNPPAPVTIRPGTTVSEAVDLMREKRQSCLLVVDAGGILTGILTERDLMNKVAGSSLDLSVTPVDGLMTSDPETVRSDHLLAHALHRMMIGDFRHLPLTDDEGRPTGLVSSREVLNYLTSQVLEIFTGMESSA